LRVCLKDFFTIADLDPICALANHIVIHWSGSPQHSFAILCLMDSYVLNRLQRPQPSRVPTTLYRKCLGMADFQALLVLALDNLDLLRYLTLSFVKQPSADGTTLLHSTGKVTQKIEYCGTRIFCREYCLSLSRVSSVSLGVSRSRLCA
jgi:hypothetical protein